MLIMAPHSITYNPIENVSVKAKIFRFDDFIHTLVFTRRLAKLRRPSEKKKPLMWSPLATWVGL